MHRSPFSLDSLRRALPVDDDDEKIQYAVDFAKEKSLQYPPYWEEVNYMYRNISFHNPQHVQLMEGVIDDDEGFYEGQYLGARLRPYKQTTPHQEKWKLDIYHKGLYFCLTLVRGDFPQTSPYGEGRMAIPLNACYWERYNFYFLDFYTVGPKGYAVIAVIPNNSDVGERVGLTQLSRERNPFFRIKTDRHGERFFYSRNLWVELYFVNTAIPLVDGTLFSWTRVITGRNRAT